MSTTYHALADYYAARGQAGLADYYRALARAAA